jgi:hypothetical protein
MIGGTVMMATNGKKNCVKLGFLPDLHDGFLDGIYVSTDKKLILNCRDVTNRPWVITVPRIRRLKADNFSEGNIIFEVNIYSGQDCPVNLIRKLQGYLNEGSESLLAGDLKIIAENNWTLVEVTSSYGCELLALSEAGPESVVAEALM